ncbi:MULTISPECIES: IS110 family transposase [unclassified Pseudomonas]|uniref:IS110 family transposase n=1 Tax=unclassified Pseudomonas TaxID=196821 RepID=UPI001905C4D0|nr:MULTISPECIES: transposase [unclassified Pseudomonas]
MSTAKLTEVILGVDTHLDVHVGALINLNGQLLGTLAVDTQTRGYLKLLTWARSFGWLQRAGVEGTGTYGAGLALVLRENGIAVFEVNRPDRSKRRLEGKSDPTDAESAARSVLAGSATAIAKTHSGAAEAMREISVVRRSAVKAKTQAINQITAGQCSSRNQRASVGRQTCDLRRQLCTYWLTGARPIPERPDYIA